MPLRKSGLILKKLGLFMREKITISPMLHILHSMKTKCIVEKVYTQDWVAFMSEPY